MRQFRSAGSVPECPAVTQRRPPGQFDSRDYARAYSSLAGAAIPGRAARGSISPRKATCQVPASGLSSFGPRSPARAIRKWERAGCREYPTSATHRKAPRRCCIAGALASSPAGFGWAGKDRRPLRTVRTIWFPHRRKGPGVVGIRGRPRPGFHGWFSPNQLRANACIAASLVAAKPCTGSGRD